MRRVYLAQYNTSEDGLGGRNIILGLFYTEHEARTALKGAWHQEVKELKLWDNLEDYLANNDNAIRSKALEKLTDEEKRVLRLE